jgi:hypothetical protein
MANKIILKKSSVVAKVPVPGDLEIGEIAVNLADAKLYTKNAGGTVIQLGGGSGSGDVVGPSSSTDNAVARFDSTTGKLIQNSAVVIDDNGNTALNAVEFDITPATLPTAQGALYWDNADNAQTLSLVMEGGNAIQQIGQEQYFRVKCSAAITEGQGVMLTGTVGASGGLTAGPATGLTKANAYLFMGVATESGAINDWIYITSFGIVRGINTTGGAESWVDGQILYYNPAVAGGLTDTEPAAPAAKIQVAAVIFAASNGSIFVRPRIGVQLDDLNDVESSSAATSDLLQYTAGGYWQHVLPSTVTGVGSANQLVTGRTIAITGDLAYTSPSFNGSGNVTAAGTLATVNSNVGSFTNASVTVNAKGLVTAASSGTAPVTSVTGTAPVVSSGGATPAISLAASYGDTQNPYASKTANFVLAAPNGAAGDPTFRAVVAADIPTLNQNTTGTAANVTGTVAVGNGGTGATTLTANNVLLGNGTSAVQAVAPGTTGNVLTSNGTTWTSAASGGGFPAGTAMLFKQTAAPTGWTKVTTDDNAALRVVSGTVGTGGTVGFTTAFASQTPTGSVNTSISAVSGSVSVTLSTAGSVSATTLTTAQMPAHRHSALSGGAGSSARGFGESGSACFLGYINSGTKTYFDIANAGGSQTLLQNTGSDNSHTHGFTNPTYTGAFSFSSGSASSSFSGSAINLAVKYVDVIVATKN